MAQNNVSQVVVEYSGLLTVIANAQVSQVVVEYSGLLNLELIGTATIPSGATVEALGVVAAGIPVVGTVTVPSAASVGINGIVAYGLPIVGTATIPSGAAVNAGGAAEVGLYTITMPVISRLGLMDLGAINLSRVLPFTLTPLDIDGDFTLVPVSTATVYPGGLVVAGLPVSNGSTVPSTASVFAGGAVGAAAIVGLSTVPSGATVPTPGLIQLQTGLFLLGSFVVPSASQVFTPGTLASVLFNLTGTLTVPSASAVYPLGVVNAGGGIYTPFQPNAGMWAGYGQQFAPIPARNPFDVELLNDRADMERLMAGVQQDSQQAQRASQGGLGSLGDYTTNPNGRYMAYCAPSPHANCHKVNLRKNLFERGKLLTPADAGAANHTVLEFHVPIGYWCSLLAYYTIYTGTGFVQGSGDIVWRLRVGNAWARNMGNLLYAMGDSAGTVTLGTAIELMSDDRVQFQVSVPNTSGNIQVGASYILCGVQGWLYPASSWAQPERR